MWLPFQWDIYFVLGSAKFNHASYKKLLEVNFNIRGLSLVKRLLGSSSFQAPKRRSLAAAIKRLNYFQEQTDPNVQSIINYFAALMWELSDVVASEPEHLVAFFYNEVAYMYISEKRKQ